MMLRVSARNFEIMHLFIFLRSYIEDICFPLLKMTWGASLATTYGFTSLTSPNFFLASSVLTLGGMITSSPGIQLIGVVTPFPSPVCSESMTLNTSLVFRPVCFVLVSLSPYVVLVMSSNK